jgi:hypothetical protein
VSGKTDAKGRFRVGGLAPGRYRVLAIPENRYTPAEQRTDGTVDVLDAPTYYPGALTFRQGARVAVVAGAETSGVEIRLARVPIVAVSGKVEGGPAGGFNAQLFISRQDGTSRSTAGIKPDGTFRLWRLYPGKYEIRATWQAPGGRDFQSVPVPFEVAGADVTKLSLRLIPPADMAGHVEFQDDGARPPQSVSAKLILVSVGMRSEAVNTDIAADGAFGFPQLRAGIYRVRLSWSDVYVASTQLGLANTDGALLDLSNGAAGGELSVRVSSATGSITGNVTDSNVTDNNGAAAGARVVLVFEGEGAPRVTTADPGGSYTFNGVAPGTYKLVAVADADRDYVEQSGRLDDYEDLMESVEIHHGEKVSHDLKRRIPTDR